MAGVMPVLPEGADPQSKATWRRRASKSRNGLVHLLDDDPAHLTVPEWRERNAGLFRELSARGFIDPAVVTAEAHTFLTDALIVEDNPAVSDPLNAGHVRAQNNNVIHFGLHLGLSPASFSVTLEASFIHDLNKSIGEPLRQDRFAVRDGAGRKVARLETMAQCVGLNHLGERTRAAIERTTELPQGALSRDVAHAIDRSIVHHGVGSSRFIARLIDGHNEWWGDEFVDDNTGMRKLVHPPQPEFSIESVVHDLADSSQQMQGGVAWLIKYPEGFWREAGLTYWQMLSDGEATASKTIAMSLKRQMSVELATCRGIIALAEAELRLPSEDIERLEEALEASVRRTRLWIDDSPDRLEKRRAMTVYHDVARALDISPAAAVDRLKTESPGSEVLDPIVWRSARALDLRRARDLARLIESQPAD